jgi:hypothetical protein
MTAHVALKGWTAASPAGIETAENIPTHRLRRIFFGDLLEINSNMTYFHSTPDPCQHAP